MQTCNNDQNLDSIPKRNYDNVVPSWRLMGTAKQLLCKLEQINIHIMHFCKPEYILIISICKIV